MPPKDLQYGPAELAIQNPDGTFTPLGEADVTLGELQLSKNDGPRWFTSENGPIEFSFTCDETTKVNIQRLADEIALRSLINLIRASRRYGYRGGYHFELREQEYKILRSATRRLCGSNPTRYVRSVIPSAPVRLFRVRKPSGHWFWCK